ncbi:MAG: ribosome biogenesis GTPase YlqF [Candidatus Izemoplasmatales bacterium]|nr:ribosome biogenesis GTPase YlqF [Candidatus Izemoplasmatales bacterium]MDD5601973.1 ribosome biogenesis GTPase YlqF [Candidatus Izemoplasmatales bacterium]MDY0372865.1 ribosome biogenesis GTPase YlqF [Candidatus Izemoplasmatales bacterium]
MPTIQWYPGHMAKAKRLIKEKLPLVDIVFELRDARIPLSSANPLLDELIQTKPRLILLNKADLADPRETRKFLEFYDRLGFQALAINSLTENPLIPILDKAKKSLASNREKEAKKGMRERPIRALVVGIPNVGKSQLINRLVGQVKAKTGDRPGVTKAQTFLKAGNGLELIDNPGVLWPKFESAWVGIHLALVGSIKDELLPLDEVVIQGLRWMINRYPERLKERYDLVVKAEDDPIALLDAIGQNRGCLLSGGQIDYERVYRLFLHDLRHHQFGPLSLETVDDARSI